MDDIATYLDRLHVSLDQNTALLIRVEEQLKTFKEKVDGLDKDMRDVKRHVDSVRAVSRVAVVIITASACLATIFRLFLKA